MIVTFTDFGLTGPYLGQMKARIFEHAPNETIIDLMVDVPAFNIKAASVLLNAFHKEFPKGTVFLCVVDPGVGSDRKPICVKSDDKWFVGPDNGLFAHIVKNSQDIELYEILWRPKKLSKSFHGRDLFAPIAAKLTLNETFEQKSIKPSNLVTLNEQYTNEIIYIDHYGNCWSSLRSEQINEKIVFNINNTHISYAPVFADTVKGHAFWYINSSGFVEFAVNQGNAQEKLKLEIGNPLQFTLE